MRVPVFLTVFAILFVAEVPSILLAQQAAPTSVTPATDSQTTEAKPESPHPPVQSRLLTVGAPKIYDDLYLRGLLGSLQSQLTNVHSIDQATLLNHIGVAQGASLNQMSTAISGSGMPSAGESTFALAPNVPAFSYPPGYTGNSSSGASPPTVYPTGTATTTTPGTTTTIGSVAPTAPVPSAPSLTIPSSLGQSSLDTYNESLQLSAEIANTALLLQGALSDAYTRNGAPKTTVTIGFPVTIQPPSIGDKELAGAVAEIHVTICSLSDAEDPSIATLLPQERTYNVASLVEKSFLGSASAIMGGVINIGGGFLWSHKRYYLVQQQETVAFLAPASTRCGPEYRSTAFTWQIRPVLGNQFVRAGNSVNFVQIAVPKLGDQGEPAEPIGKACVEVLWRKPAVTGLFQRKSDAYLDSSQFEPQTHCYPIDYYNGMTARNHSLSVTDAGQGNVTLTAVGTFVPGTSLRLGNSYLPPVNIPATHDSLTFSVPATAIVAAELAYFVGRDGRETPAVRRETAKQPLKINSLKIEPYSDSQSMLTLAFTAPEKLISGDNSPTVPNPGADPWVVVIGGEVFGLSNAPFFSQTDAQIQLIVPTSLIQGSQRVEMERLLWERLFYSASATIPPDTFSKALPAVSATSLLSSQNGLTLGLVGSGLAQIRMAYPTHDLCPSCTLSNQGSTFLTVALLKPAAPKKDDKSAKDKPPPFDPSSIRQLVLCRYEKTDQNKCDGTFPPLLVSVPKSDSPPAAKPSLDTPDPVPVNATQVSITGIMLDQVVSIEHAKFSFPFRLVSGKKPSLTVDLPPSIASVPGGYGLLVTFADKSTAGSLLTIK